MLLLHALIRNIMINNRRKIFFNIDLIPLPINSFNIDDLNTKEVP